MIVDCGANTDVSVEHPIYGELVGNRKGVHNWRAMPSTITSDLHLHAITCRDEKCTWAE